MDDLIRKIAAPAPAPGGAPAPAPAPGVAKEDRDALATQLEAAFDAIELGVAEGKSKDFANERSSAIFGSFINSITSLLTGSAPSTRLSETKIKVEVGFEFDEKMVHEKAINGFKQRIIAPARTLYYNNFNYYIDSIQKNNTILQDITKNQIASDTAVRARTISSEIMALTLHSAPKRHRSGSFQFWADGPYQIIMTEAIDRLREKFSAIMTFSTSTGKAIASRIRDGSQTPDDEAFLRNLFVAIYEWFIYLDAFGTISASDTSQAGSGTSSSSSSTSGDRPCPGEPVPKILSEASIASIEAGRGMRISATTAGQIEVDRSGTGSLSAALKLILVKNPSVAGAGDISRVDACWGNIDYIEGYIANGTIDVTGSAAWPGDIEDAISSVVSNRAASGPGGEASVELIIHFKDSFIAGLPPGGQIFHINHPSAPMDIVASDNRLQDQLTKLSSSATTPFYETVSPDGERVFFTPADLVVGSGRVRGAKGKPFRPKKIKGKSLAERVNSKGFGKIRDWGDK